MEDLLEIEHLGKDVASSGNAGSATLAILHDISLQVQSGESLAIVGASGSGKTTLLGLMAGLDMPTRGAVKWQGQDITLLDEDARAALRGRMLGFVFQSFQLLPTMTALENVMLPLELQGAGNARERSIEVLTRVGLAQRTSHYPKHLSGGEQQRVALARAFVVNPVLLLADEPTGNLDAATGADIIELMFAMNAERGTTLVLVTHDDALAARCGRVLRMSGGRFVGTQATA